MAIYQKRFGHTLLRLDSVGSTNDVARSIAVAGGEEGMVVLAREQTSGRGSKGRSWISTAGKGLYLSLILRPRLGAAESTILTLAAAVAVAETIKDGFGLDTDIKWPNDVLIKDRKVSGILVESATERDSVLYAIIGIGVNLTHHAFPAEIAETATSLLIECKRDVGVEEFLGPLLERLERWCRTEATSIEVLDRYRQLSSYANGCPVRVTQGSNDRAAFEGITRGLTSTGSLIIELPSGERKHLFSGEVTSIRTKQGPGA